MSLQQRVYTILHIFAKYRTVTMIDACLVIKRALRVENRDETVIDHCIEICKIIKKSLALFQSIIQIL